MRISDWSSDVCSSDLQAWRLGHWRLAREMLPYRRFFEISDLVGVRVEDPAVFRDVHTRALALLADGTVAGLRIGPIDGLAAPKGYLCPLRDAGAEMGRASWRERVWQDV